MKKACIFFLFVICSLSPSVLLSQNNSNSKNQTTNNPFKSDVFVENYGQFYNWLQTKDTIIYALINGEKVFFTPHGLIFRIDRVKKAKKTAHEENEERESDDEGNPPEFTTNYIYMNWANANANVKIEVSNKVENYYTFGEKGYENVKAKGFGKLVYKNIYQGIDVEYTIPGKGGIKYKLIVHPGADLSKVKMQYSGDVKKIKTSIDGNIIISTNAGEIIDHVPSSYYENNNPVASAFIINKNIVQFSLPQGYNKNETLIIDPWTTTPTSLISDNAAYDIAYDDNRNLYVTGGTYLFKLAKYSPAGTLLWTFTNPTGWDAGATCYSKFDILPNSGTILIGEGWNSSGPRMMKISNSGVLVTTTANMPGNQEIWVMFYNRCTGKLVGFGGGTGNAHNMQIGSDTNLTSTTCSNFNSWNQSDNDIASVVQDINGDFYALISSQIGYDNYICKSLASSGYAPPPAWAINSNYNDFYECANSGIPGFNSTCAAGPQTVRANTLAVNDNYLFSYDGQILKAWNKATGAQLGTITVSGSYTGGQYRTHEGIACDDCNNVYVGGTSQVHVFAFSGSAFTALPSITTNIPNEVYDIELDRMFSTLYVCGLGFVTVTPTTVACAVQQLIITDSISYTSASCTSTAIVTVSGGIAPYTYQWSNGSTTDSISNVGTGTYIVTVTDNSCIRLRGIDTVTINSSFGITISPDTGVCAGVSVPLVASGGTSYSWSPSSTLSNPNIPNPIASPTSSTIYTVTVSNGTCSGTSSVTVNIISPVINVSNDTAICQGDSVMLHALGGGSGFTWSPAGSLNNANISNPIAGTTSTTIYYVTVTNGGCQKFDSIKVSVNPVPNVTASSVTICSGQTNTLFAGGATSYIWDGGSTNSYIIVNPTTTTVYTVTGTSSGCSKSASGTVTVNPSPNAQISPYSNATCGLNNGTATATGGINYFWSNGQNTASVTGLAPGNYTVTAVDNNGCSATAGITITQTPNVSVALSSIDSVKCFGQANGSISVIASSGTPSYNYVWNTLPVQTSATATGLIPGTYTCIVTDANGCTSSINATVQQPSPLTSVISNADSTLLCYGQNVGYITIGVSGGTPSFIYHWNTGASSASINSLSAGTYTVTITDHNGCTNTKTVTIIQPSDIVLSILSYTGVSCFGGSNGSATASATGGVTPYLSFIWDDGETTQTATHLNPGVHSVTVTDANGCTKTTTVTITQPPQINMTEVTDSVLCYGQANGSITVTATGGTLPYASYIWNTGQSGSVASNLHVGTYTCTVTDANGCIDSIKAHVLQPLMMTSIVINADTILPCYGLNNGTITIYVVGGTPPFTYHWNTGATGTMTLNNLSGGVYTDTITDHNGCKNIHTVVVSQPPDLFVQIDSIPESCLNTCDGQLTSAVTGGIPFIGSGGLPYYHYLWSTVPPQTTESITGLCEGTYNLTITDSNGCKKIISEYIGVNDSVVAGFSAAPTSGYIPLTVNFVYTGTSSSGNNYTWNFGDGTISNLENPTHIYTVADTFSVWLYIMNGICKDSIHIFVYPEIPSLLIVPNVFTPNGDGYNDEFMVKYQNIKTFNCVIFDRWGKKIYEWDDVTKGWDGKTKGGADCSDGTYFYILSAEGWDGLKYSDHGTVTLLR